MNKKTPALRKNPFWLVLIRMFTNFGRDIVFSADLWYNGFSKSLPPRGRWHGVAVTEGVCVILGLC